MRSVELLFFSSDEEEVEDTDDENGENVDDMEMVDGIWLDGGDVG